MPIANVRYIGIRVDHKRNIFNADDPGIAQIDEGGIVKEVVKQAQVDDGPLAKIRLSNIKVYRLKSPVFIGGEGEGDAAPTSLDQPPEDGAKTSDSAGRAARTTRSAESTTVTTTANPKLITFTALREQIKLFGVDTHLLDRVKHGQPVTIFKKCDHNHFNAVLYHCPLPEDYGNAPEEGGRELGPILERPTFETARIENLKKLGHTAPCDATGRDRYNHVFMGHPHAHRTLPVAVYDPILAQLAYKLGKLDVGADEAQQLFPNASNFCAASAKFAVDAAGDYSSEDDRGKVTFKWLEAVFGEKCSQQVCIGIPPSKAKASTTNRTTKVSAGRTTKSADSNTPSSAAGSNSSNASTVSKRAYAIPDGALVSVAGDSQADILSVDAMVTQLGTADERTRILRAIFELKNKYRDAILQGAKVFARSTEGLDAWIVEQTCFPTMIITAEGHLFRIAILVNVGATLVEKLVLLDIHSRVPTQAMITRLERIASALRACSDQLETYYKGLSKETTPEKKRLIRFPQPTIVPTATKCPGHQGPLSLQSALGGPGFPQLVFKSYLQRDGDEDISYFDMSQKPSEKARIMRGLFVAEMTEYESGPKLEVAVKFAETYSAEAHEYLHELEIAPKLHYYHHVIGNVLMIVMERVKGRQWSELKVGDVNQSAIDKLRTQLKKFHQRNFVHGDLRECNVMLDGEGRPMVIDFDWAGKQNIVRYPKNVNTDLVGKELHHDVTGDGLILQTHDEFGLDVLENKVFVKTSSVDNIAAITCSPNKHAARFLGPGSGSVLRLGHRFPFPVHN